MAQNENLFDRSRPKKSGPPGGSLDDPDDDDETLCDSGHQVTVAFFLPNFCDPLYFRY